MLLNTSYIISAGFRPADLAVELFGWSSIAFFIQALYLHACPTIIVQSSLMYYYVCQKNRDRRVFSVVCDRLDAANAEFGRPHESNILRYC